MSIEEVALQLFADEGYSNTTVESLAAASGVSKTTFFRYFRSKSDIVWGVFDRHIDRLRAIMAASDNAVPMTAVRLAVVSALTADTDEDGVWLARFRLLDTSPELRKEALAHWHAWALVVAEFVGGRTGHRTEDLGPAAVGAAVQAVVVAELRNGVNESMPPRDLIARLDAELVPLCEALQHWLDSTVDPR
ncbi:TetR family transcriptional regulator [Salinibacterium sp. ZJ454]|uniref:acyl-CoA-like ligand-binding transcription factor n=1 Tax=Salinibacterium sp. ZJ454 TaxID=2708339 RepID=UPI00141FD993|nr:TetR family transcriptional regulator [Salinibacterium sp. ZJ454]